MTSWIKKEVANNLQKVAFSVTRARPKLRLGPPPLLVFLNFALVLAVWFIVVVITKALQFKSNEILS